MSSGSSVQPVARRSFPRAREVRRPFRKHSVPGLHAAAVAGQHGPMRRAVTIRFYLAGVDQPPHLDVSADNRPLHASPVGRSSWRAVRQGDVINFPSGHRSVKAVRLIETEPPVERRWGRFGRGVGGDRPGGLRASRPIRRLRVWPAAAALLRERSDGCTPRMSRRLATAIALLPAALAAAYVAGVYTLCCAATRGAAPTWALRAQAEAHLALAGTPIGGPHARLAEWCVRHAI